MNFCRKPKRIGSHGGRRQEALSTAVRPSSNPAREGPLEAARDHGNGRVAVARLALLAGRQGLAGRTAMVVGHALEVLEQVPPPDSRQIVGRRRSLGRGRTSHR